MMNKFRFIILLTVLSFCFSATYAADGNRQQTSGDQEFTLYEVQRSEGLYRISVKTGVTQEEIIANNPEISTTGLHTGQILRIPKQASETKKESGDEFIMHVVQKKETLYSLSKRYDVEIDLIKELNPNVKKNLKAETILRIPKKTSPEEIISEEIEEIIPEEYVPIVAPSKKPIRIALLLPLMLDVDRDPTADKFIEFYEGCLLAIKELKSKGISIELYTFDTGKTDLKVRLILSNAIFNKIDLIIGPAYSTQVNIVESFAQRNKINLIVPFSPRVESIETNPYVYQNNAPTNVRFDVMAKSFATQFKDKNLIIVHFTNDLNNENNEFAKHFEAHLRKERIPYSPIYTSEGMFSANIRSVLVENKENIVLLGTERVDVAHRLAATLNAEKNLSVIGFPSWQNSIFSFNNIYLVSQFHIDTDSEVYKKYNSEFRHYFGHAITTMFPRFDILGYDLMLYFGKAFDVEKKTLEGRLPQNDAQLVQSEFHFVKKNRGGYINERFWLIHINSTGSEKIKIR